MSIFRAFLGRNKLVSEHDIQVLEADKKALSDMLNRHRDDLATARRQLLGANWRAQVAEQQAVASGKRADEEATRSSEAEKFSARTLKRAEEAEAKLAEALAAQKAEPVRRKPGRPRKVL